MTAPVLAPLTVEAGTDWSATMTYTRDSVPTQVDDPVAEARQGPSRTYALVVRMDADTYITQDDPGVLVFALPAAVTIAFPLGEWHWDFFGTVAGRRLKLVPMSPFIVVANVSDA